MTDSGSSGNDSGSSGSEEQYYAFQQKVERLLRGLNDLELDGATKVITEFHTFLDELYFDEKRELKSRAFVKTLESLFESCCEEICDRTRASRTGSCD
jgi:hypothetical protein